MSQTTLEAYFRIRPVLPDLTSLMVRIKKDDLKRVVNSKGPARMGESEPTILVLKDVNSKTEIDGYINWDYGAGSYITVSFDIDPREFIHRLGGNI